MKFFERLQELLEENDISQRKLISDLDIGSGTISTWKARGTIPNGEILVHIADYFNVSVDYLLGKDSATMKSPPNIGEISEQQQAVYERIISLSPKEIVAAEAYIDFLISRRGKDNE